MLSTQRREDPPLSTRSPHAVSSTDPFASQPPCRGGMVADALSTWTVNRSHPGCVPGSAVGDVSARPPRPRGDVTCAGWEGSLYVRCMLMLLLLKIIRVPVSTEGSDMISSIWGVVTSDQTISNTVLLTVRTPPDVMGVLNKRGVAETLLPRMEAWKCVLETGMTDSHKSSCVD